MEQKNIFVKGHKTDIDPSYMDNKSFREAKNFRFIRRDGRGFVASPLNSNELEFEIEPDYAPLNGIEYKGIYYLVSYNSKTDTTEIGSFPSPGENGFERKYKPLQTLLKDTRDLNFNTKALGLSWDNSLDIIARETYNGSVNLYLCDHVNPNYVINTGFNQSGERTPELLKESELPEKVYQFKAPKSYPELESFSLTDGGSNKPGAYHIYIRYVDSSMTGTVFVNSFGPFVVDEDGAGLIDDMGKSKRAIRLNLKNLDIAYPYFQIGISRKSENDNVLVSDTYLIDNLFTTKGEATVTIYGSENNSLLSNEELIMKNSSFVSCKSHTIHDGKYVGANWKSTKRDYDLYSQIAQAVEVKPHIVYNKVDYSYNDYLNKNTNMDKPSEIVYDNVGYMRGEIYPFAMVFIFKDGSESQPVPIKGKDLNGNLSDNDKGLVMMPDFGSNLAVNSLNNLIHVKFDLAAAKSIIQNSEEMKQVKSFYFVRGDRIKNRTYTGLLHATSFAVLGRGVGNGYYTGNILFLGKENADNNNYIAFGDYTEYQLDSKIESISQTNDFKNHKEKSLHVPFLLKTLRSFRVAHGHFDHDNVVTHEGLMSDKYFAFYSPGHLFSSEHNIQNYYFRPLFHANTDNYRERYSLPIDGDHDETTESLIGYGREIIDYKNHGNLSLISEDASAIEVVNIPEAMGRGAYNFSTILHQRYHGENEPPQGEPGWNITEDTQYELTRTNGNIKFKGFLGVKFNQSFNHKKGVIGSFVKYKTIGEYYTGVTASFSVKNTLYKKISDIFIIENVNNNNSFTVGKGDVFINKVFFRQARWIGNPTDFKDKDYAHAVLLGLVVESELNTFLRNEVPATDENGSKIRYSFFPKVLEEKTFNDWVFWSRDDEDIYEAMQINRGYSYTLPDRALFGYDEALPENGVARPTRFYFSGEQKINAFADAFSTINPGSYVDYPSEDGEVMAVNSINGNLFSANRLGLVQYYSGQSEIQSNPSTGSIVVNSNYQFLSPKSRKFADFGIQHHKAIVSTGEAVFGVDAYKKKLWVVSLGYTSSGYAMLSAKDIAKEQLVNSKVLKLINDYIGDEARYNEYIDRPAKEKGIVLAHDPEYNEVLFSFYDKTKENGGSTYVFSLEMGAFNDEYSIVSPHYFNLSNKLLSANPDKQNEIYKHNNTEEALRFYGKKHLSLVQIIVTGVSGESNLNSHEKEFFNCQIRSPELELKDIIYRTETQKSVLSPFLDHHPIMFFRNPDHYEGKWEVPIPLQNNTGEDYEIGSSMRGDYLSMTLRYDKKDKGFFIKHVITNFEISF